jgi:DNA-binding NtrC family response regulator
VSGAAPRVLVVEDNDALRRGIARVLRASGFSIDQEATGDAAVRRLSAARVADYDAVLTDLRLPGADGVAVLRAARASDPRSCVLVITAYGSVETAVESMRAGACDFVQKPFDLEALPARIERALAQRDGLGDARSGPRGERVGRRAADRIVGESPVLRDAVDLALRVAATRSTVLLTGETGTGKEGLADLVHAASLRSSGPLVKVNCAALPETLLESELFGHERGAFTGADRRRAGRFEEANGGTLLLDEIGELGASTQVKLLRVLQDREYRRLGGTRTLRSDARIVAATQVDLEREVRAGRFREDLYFRLDVIRIHLPPLRERMEDLVPLVAHFLRELGARMDSPAQGFEPAALERLASHAWPGNVRELRNVVERALLLARGPRIRPEEVILNELPRRRPGLEETPASELSLAEAERRLVLEALRRCNFVQKDASAQLGISRRKLNYMIRRLGITHPSWRRNRAPGDAGGGHEPQAP